MIAYYQEKCQFPILCGILSRSGGFIHNARVIMMSKDESKVSADSVGQLCGGSGSPVLVTDFTDEYGSSIELGITDVNPCNGQNFTVREQNQSLEAWLKQTNKDCGPIYPLGSNGAFHPAMLVGRVTLPDGSECAAAGYSFGTVNPNVGNCLGAAYEKSQICSSNDYRGQLGLIMGAGGVLSSCVLLGMACYCLKKLFGPRNPGRPTVINGAGTAGSGSPTVEAKSPTGPSDSRPTPQQETTGTQTRRASQNSQSFIVQMNSGQTSSDNNNNNQNNDIELQEPTVTIVDKTLIQFS